MPRPAPLESDEIVDDDQRVARGWLTVQLPDSKGQVLPVDEVLKSLPGWMERGAPISDPTHTDKIVGKGVNFEKAIHPVHGVPGIRIDYQIHKGEEYFDHHWNGIKSGRVKGLSWSGQYGKAVPMEVKGTPATKLDGHLVTFAVASCADPVNPYALNTHANLKAASGDKENESFITLSQAKELIATALAVNGKMSTKSSDLSDGEYSSIAQGLVNAGKTKAQIVSELLDADPSRSRDYAEETADSALLIMGRSKKSQTSVKAFTINQDILAAADRYANQGLNARDIGIKLKHDFPDENPSELNDIAESAVQVMQSKDNQTAGAVNKGEPMDPVQEQKPAPEQQPQDKSDLILQKLDQLIQVLSGGQSQMAKPSTKAGDGETVKLPVSVGEKTTDDPKPSKPSGGSMQLSSDVLDAIKSEVARNFSSKSATPRPAQAEPALVPGGVAVQLSEKPKSFGMAHDIATGKVKLNNRELTKHMQEQRDAPVRAMLEKVRGG